jgi:hypothetical protein
MKNISLDKASTFVALRNPVYRRLWLAILLSGTCVAAQDTAATWTMNRLGASTFLLSLISTVASLPFFLFTLPAGALADIVNRRKLLCLMNLWLASAAVLLAIPLSINFTTSLSFDPPPINCLMTPLVNKPQPRDGPVAIKFEIEVDRMRGREFLRLMREVRLIHLRNGAFGWRLDEDLTRSNIYRIEMMVPSWSGYLLQRERLTKTEQETIKKVWQLHVGGEIPEERYYLSVNREMGARGTMATYPLSISRAPLIAQEVQQTS